MMEISMKEMVEKLQDGADKRKVILLRMDYLLAYQNR